MNEYSIYKVSDDRIEAFRKKFKEKIVIEGKSIAEVNIQFDQLTKESSFTFNPELKKFKEAV